MLLVAMEGPGRGLACAFETSTMMWGSVEVRFGCRTSCRIFFFINSVQPAMGLVLHGWAYYLWLGGHYVAGVYPRDVVSNRIYKLVMSSGH